MTRILIVCVGLACAGVALPNAYAQNRFIGANKFLLDDGAGHSLILQMSVPALGGTLILPGNGGTLSSLLGGTVTGQTLYWNNGPKDWEASSIFTNDGLSQLGFTGQMTGTSSAAGYTLALSNTNANAVGTLAVNAGSSFSNFFSAFGTYSAGSSFGVIGTTIANVGYGAGVFGANGNPSTFLALSPAPGVMALTTTSGSGLIAVSSGAGSGSALVAESIFGSTNNAADFFGNVGITGQLKATSTSAANTASIVNTNASALSALTVNQGSSILPTTPYASAATISAGSTFGIIGTASSAANGAGVYGATDNLSTHNVVFSAGAGVEGVSFGVGDAMVALQQGGTGDAFEAAVSGGTGLAGKFVGDVGITGQLIETSAAAGYTTTFNNTNASPVGGLSVSAGSAISAGYTGVGVFSAATQYGVIGTTIATNSQSGAGVFGANSNLSSFTSITPAPGVLGVTTTLGTGVVAISSGAGSGPALFAGAIVGSTSDAGDFVGNVAVTGGNLGVAGNIAASAGNVTASGYVKSGSALGTGTPLNGGVYTDASNQAAGYCGGGAPSIFTQTGNWTITRLGVGVYKITFPYSVSILPAISVTIVSPGSVPATGVISFLASSPFSFNVSTFNAAGALTDEFFMFTVVGPHN